MVLWSQYLWWVIGSQRLCFPQQTSPLGFSCAFLSQEHSNTEGRCCLCRGDKAGRAQPRAAPARAVGYWCLCPAGPTWLVTPSPFAAFSLEECEAIAPPSASLLHLQNKGSKNAPALLSCSSPLWLRDPQVSGSFILLKAFVNAHSSFACDIQYHTPSMVDGKAADEKCMVQEFQPVCEAGRHRPLIFF